MQLELYIISAAPPLMPKKAYVMWNQKGTKTLQPLAADHVGFELYRVTEQDIT